MKSPVNTLTDLIAAAQVVPLTEGASDEGVWIKIMPAGRFTGRDGRGPFDAGDLAAMQAIIERSQAVAGSIDMMIDYDHQSFYGVKEGVAGTARASGWFRKLEARADGIYGLVDWTAAAREAIRAKEYRYISPLFAADKEGRVTFIRNAGLVNQPALDIPAVAANLSTQTEEGESMKAIAMALGLPETATESEIAAAIAALNSGHQTIAASVSLGTDAKAEDVVAAVTATRDQLGRIAVAAGLSSDAKADDIIAAVSAKSEAGKPDPAKFVPMSMFTDLQNDLKALQEGESKKAVNSAVDKAIADGKVTPAQKDWAMSYAQKDLAGFEAFVSGAPVLTGTQLRAEKLDPAKPSLTDADKFVAASLGLTEEQFIAARQKEAN